MSTRRPSLAIFPPLPVRRERVGVRVLRANDEKARTLTLAHSRRTGRGNRKDRRGIIFITTRWVVVILTALVLIFARSMRTEVAASSNRFSAQQADAIELGAEQFVIAAVDQSNGDAATVLQTKTEQIPVGPAGQPSGYFWILQTYPDNDYTYAFGITDESSKVNINFANASGARACRSGEFARHAAGRRRQHQRPLGQRRGSLADHRAGRRHQLLPVSPASLLAQELAV